jgi:hypothetical protein
MIPIIPILAWTGGIAAGAQVAGGFVRGVGELVRGRPGAAVGEVASGCVAPLKLMCQEVSTLGHDVYLAVLGPWQSAPAPEPEPEPEGPVAWQPQRPHRRRQRPTKPASESLNGVSGVAAEG